MSDEELKKMADIINKMEWLDYVRFLSFISPDYRQERIKKNLLNAFAELIIISNLFSEDD